MSSGNSNPEIKELLEKLSFLDIAEPLFDSLSNVVFFVKDCSAKYVAVNKTLITRCGMQNRKDLIGKTVLDLFPAPYNKSYHEQDLQVLSTDSALHDMLELHLYTQGGQGWCVTTKLPLHDDKGNVIGLAGISSDIQAPATQDKGYLALSKGITYIQENISEELRVDAVAKLCKLSIYQFEQRMKRVFQLTAGQFINKTRIENARRLLEQADIPIVDIALSCGYSDQSAFTRQFKATTGITPADYRKSLEN